MNGEKKIRMTESGRREMEIMKTVHVILLWVVDLSIIRQTRVAVKRSFRPLLNISKGGLTKVPKRGKILILGLGVLYRLGPLGLRPCGLKRVSLKAHFYG
jgi:hypothetical protein